MTLNLPITKEQRCILLFFVALLFNITLAYSTEDCANGLDDDQDGLIDCGDPDCYSSGLCEDAFECTSTLYQVISSTLKSLNVAKSSYDDIGVAKSGYNGAGFNFQDGYIYGIKKNNGYYNLWKINNAGQEEDLGTIANFGGINYAGDFDQSGNLYTYKSGSYPRLYYVDVDVTPLTHKSVELTNLSGSSIPGAADITFNPVTGKLYGLSSGPKLVIIDPINLTIDVNSAPKNILNISGAFGAAYSDSEGNSYFSNNSDGRIFKVTFDDNFVFESIQHVANGTPTSSNDGMSCSNSLPPFETDCGDGIDNDADGLVDCADPDCFVDAACPLLSATLKCQPETGPNGIIPFYLRLINDSQADAIDFSIEEILPYGFSFLYDSLEMSVGANQVSDANDPVFGDRDTLTWSSLNIPVGDTLEISYSVLVDEDLGEGIYNNYVSASNVLLNPSNLSHEILVSNYVIEEKSQFICKPAFYQVYKKRGEPNVYAKLNIETGSYNEIAQISNQADGLGFDYNTGLAYGAEGRLFISIDSLGIVENLGSLFNKNVFVGDTDTLGYWYGKDGGDMVKVDILSRSIVDRYTGQGMPGWDMAYNKDGNFYAVHKQTLYKYDTDSNTKSTIGTLIGDEVPNSGHGAQWTGSDRRLYISNNSTGKIYRIDVESREAKLMMQATPGLQFNDGFSCPIELPTPLTFDHHDNSNFPAAQIFTYSQNTNGVPDLDAVWAGSGVNYENESLAYITAEGDSYDDGLTYSTYLPPNTTANFEIGLNTNMTAKEVFYGMWIDWNSDNSPDSFYQGSEVLNGYSSQAVPVIVPSDFTDGKVSVRLIVSEIEITEGDLALFDDDITGEVEDYVFMGNTSVDCGNGLDDDNDGLVDCDDPDCFDNCKYTTTKSGFDGGLESNNRLSHKVNETNYNKKRRRTESRNTKSKQAKIDKKEFYSELKRNKSSQVSVRAYMPIDVLPNTESYTSSPQHLINITNATELYAVDIYEGANRKGVVLGLSSEDGVYEHTKYVCDRLAGSKILDILNYQIDFDTTGNAPDQYDFVIPKMELEGGQVEYALSFSVRDTATSNGDEFILESHWNLDDYTKNERYYNFQVWASNVRDLEILVKAIYHNVTNTALYGKSIANRIMGESPVFYINSASYDEDMLTLNITNKSALTNVKMEGKYSLSETDGSSDLDMTLALNGSEKETVSVNLGRMFDLGITFYHEALNAHDVIFLADGSWNTSYNSLFETVGGMTVVPGTNYADENFEVDRNISINGSVKNFISLYRAFNADFQDISLDSFETLSFTASGSGKIELAVVKEGVTDWLKQGKYTFDLSDAPQTFSLSKDHFINEDNVSQDWSDLYMLVFTIVGDGNNTVDFDVNISDVFFGPNMNNEDFMVYTESSIVTPISGNHIANFVDATNRGRLIYDAQYDTDIMEFTIKNIGTSVLSIDDIIVDAPNNHFNLVDFDPSVIGLGASYKFQIQYEPGETPITSEANIILSINGDDTYNFNITAQTECPENDYVGTTDVLKNIIGAQKEYRAINDISSDAQVEQRNIMFKAGNSVELNSGFEILNNSSLDVLIKNECQD